MPALEQRLRTLVDANAPTIDVAELFARVEPLRSLDDEGLGARRKKRPFLLVAAAGVAVVTMSAMTWLLVDHASNDDRVRVSNQISAPAVPVADDGWDAEVPRSVRGPSDPNVDKGLPERVPVSGQDGNWAGYADRSALNAVPNTAATPGDPQAAVDAYSHEFVPLTETADPGSPLVGYLLRGYGFVDPQTIKARDFDAVALVAEAQANRDQSKGLYEPPTG